MKSKKTAILVLVTALLVASVYYFEFRKIAEKEKAEAENTKILELIADQINYLEIQGPQTKLVLQKNEKGWFLQEPIQDQADDLVVENLVKNLMAEKYLAIAADQKSGNHIDWAQFGLAQPDLVYIFKNNAGKSQKVQVGSQKNFEGNSFLRIDGQERVVVGMPLWASAGHEKLVYFRQKSLFRHPPTTVTRVKIKSLSDQFELVYADQKWTAVGHEEYILDQNKVRKMIADISETAILDYVVEGDPSESQKNERGLKNPPVEINFNTDKLTWSVALNLNEKDKAIYAVTDRPTYLVQLDVSRWAFFGNLAVDSLRDRSTNMTFALDRVQKVFIRKEDSQYDMIQQGGRWTLATKKDDSVQEANFRPEAADELVGKIHDMEISHFVGKDEALKFKGTNMIILKSSDDQLIFQLNWGPEITKKIQGQDKQLYLARTQLSDMVFTIEKSKIDELPISELFKKKE